jgi:metallophosphoesterase (TIGR00282 family)
MRVLMIGDIVGAPGIAILKQAVPQLRQEHQLDLVIANAENATNGSGLSPKDYRQVRAAGVDAITLGDHIYKKNDIAEILQKSDEPICKPANYPSVAPGRDHIRLVVGDTNVAILSLMGRTFMRPVDCPFQAADRVLNELNNWAKVIIVDMHAEATADKYLMVHHLKGRVSAVLGTHTHVQTADEKIFPEGTAFLCDVGMTGPYDGILGRRADRVLTTSITFVPSYFDVSSGDLRLAGAIVDIDDATGKATQIQRVMKYA